MRILGIDSSGRTASVSLVENGAVLIEYSLNIGLTHSQTLLPMVDRVLSDASLKVFELDGIAVSSGPGSFTGLRIGAATAKGLSLPYGIPLLGVHTLEMLAFNFVDSPYMIHPIMDARRSQVYTAAFQNGKMVSQEEAIAISDLIERISINTENITRLFLGDGVPVYRDYIDKHLKAPHCYASPQNMFQRASSLALIAYERLKDNLADHTDYNFRLNYLRKPQAERERERKGLSNFCRV